MNRAFSEPRWIQIGKVCPAGRRSLWVRFTRTSERVQKIELCAGREGDDTYVCFHRPIETADREAKVQFSDLEDVLSTAIWVNELIADKEEEKKEHEAAPSPVKQALQEALKGDPNCTICNGEGMYQHPHNGDWHRCCAGNNSHTKVQP